MKTRIYAAPAVKGLRLNPERTVQGPCLYKHKHDKQAREWTTPSKTSGSSGEFHYVTIRMSELNLVSAICRNGGVDSIKGLKQHIAYKYKVGDNLIMPEPINISQH